MQNEPTPIPLAIAPRRRPCETPFMSLLTTRSVLDLDDPFLQYGLGLLLIAKSANDSLFHKLVASIKSPEKDTRDQARRTLSRWAKSNTSYSSLVEKAGKLSPDKREIVLNHFKAIPTCDDERELEICSEHGRKVLGISCNPIEALRAARRVSRWLLEHLETPTTKLEGAGEDSTPAEGAVPEKGVGQSSGRECPEGEVEKDNNPTNQANGNENDEEQEGPIRNDENGTTQVAQTSMSPLPKAPHLASATSGHSIGSVSPPDPPAPAEPRRNYPVRNRNRCSKAAGESGTCPTSTRPETSFLSEVVAEWKERRGKAQGKGCDRVGVSTTRQGQVSIIVKLVQGYTASSDGIFMLRMLASASEYCCSAFVVVNLRYIFELLTSKALLSEMFDELPFSAFQREKTALKL